MVKHIIPSDLKSALEHLSTGTFQVIAGGTDLMIQKRSTAGTPPHFEKDMLYIANLRELNYCREDAENLHIGATITLEEILHHQATPKLLKLVISDMASPGIRHTGTLAGNIANASPAGDSLVALYLLDALVVLASKKGERIIPLEKFITGVRRTLMQPDELIKEIIVPHQHFDHIKWVKVGGRRADAISKVAFAGAYTITNKRISDLRLSFGAVAPTVVRSHEIEETLKNRFVKDIKGDLKAILEKYYDLITPIDDQRSNKIYRQEVALNLAKEFIMNIKEEE